MFNSKNKSENKTKNNPHGALEISVPRDRLGGEDHCSHPAWLSS